MPIPSTPPLISDTIYTPKTPPVPSRFNAPSLDITTIYTPLAQSDLEGNKSPAAAVPLPDSNRTTVLSKDRALSNRMTLADTTSPSCWKISRATSSIFCIIGIGLLSLALLGVASTGIGLPLAFCAFGIMAYSLITTSSSSSSPSQAEYQSLASAVYGRVTQEDARDVTPAYQQGTPATYTQIGDNYSSPAYAVHSESVGYKMLVDISNNDKDAFLKDTQFMACYLDNYGLMNWNVDPSTGLVVSGYNGHYAATDADQDIAYAMIQALIKWPELATQTINTTQIGFDSTTNSEVAPAYGSTTFEDLLKSQLEMIWSREVGHNSSTGINQLILNGDGWGRDADGNYEPSQGLDLSYFRPSYYQAFQTFYDTYMKNDSSYDTQTWYSTDSSADCVYNAEYNYLVNCMKNNTLCLPPDSTLPAPGTTQYQPGGSLMGGGYDAVRVVMFVAMDYQQNPTSPQAVQAKQILQTIVGYYSQQTLSSSSFSIPSPSTGQLMTELCEGSLRYRSDACHALLYAPISRHKWQSHLQSRQSNGCRLPFDRSTCTGRRVCLTGKHLL